MNLHFISFLLAVLKLTGVIHISWWWVFSPTLFAFGITAVLLMFAGVAAVYAVKR